MTADTRGSDAALMRRVQHDDTDAFRVLYERNARSAYGAALAITRSPRLAEDTVQEAFLTLWRRRASYAPERGSVGGWLLTIVRSRALDALRRTVRRDRPWEPLDDHDVADAALEDAGEQAVRREERRVVRAALTQLPVEQVTVLGLAYYAGLSQSEIAQHLDVPLGTVKGRIRLGLRRLSAELTPVPATAGQPRGARRPEVAPA
jgi:RNA polymerase sigma-70 factor (ECF subfamily)